MFKTHLILAILLLLGACNNKLAINVPGTQVATPEPYHMQGRAVSTFGTAGRAEYDNPFDAARTAQLKYSVEKQDGSRYQIGIARNTFNALKVVIYKIDGDTGVADGTFGTGGFFEVPSGAAAATQNDNVWDAEIVNDRYILMCGYEDPAAGRAGWVKLFDTQTEAMVATFGAGGILMLNSVDGARPRSFANRCRYDQQLNRFVVTYTNSSAGNLYRSYLKVLDFTGADVASFNGGSPLMVSHPSLTDEINTFPVIVTDQHYYVAGEQFDAGNTYAQSYIAKYDKTGTLVNSFGTNGVKLFTASSDATNITLIEYITDGEDGYFYSTFHNHTYTDYRLVRISQSNGEMDLGFGTAGYVDFKPDIVASVGPMPGLFGIELRITDDDKIIYGWADNFAGLSQFTKTGAVDSSFGSAGSLLLPVPAGATSSFAWSFTRNYDGTFTVQGESTVAGLRKMNHWKIE